MSDNTTKIGFGGGCHWCTEAIFQSLKGVNLVEQGWISSEGENNYFSEAVIVHFEPTEINLATLIEVHLHTHSCTSNHSMRKKYRSAVYYYSPDQKQSINKILADLQSDFEDNIITKAYPLVAFKKSPENVQNYYLKDPNKPFCRRCIAPKLSLVLNKFGKEIFVERLTLNS